VVAVVEEMVATVAGAAVVTVPMDLDMVLVVVELTLLAVVVQQVVVEVEQQRCCSPLWVSI
jgi:hypothetical protein|tara:strand:- start:2012 stop:2194 length:183 start_codon:yes stop_codon:yes gene_type:complete